MSGKENMDKGHYHVTKLNPDVKECWFYTGKQSSIHIIANPIFIEKIINGEKYKIEVPIPQFNIDLPSIRKSKV